MKKLPEKEQKKLDKILEAKNMNSWKTSLAGIAAILTSLGLLIKGYQLHNYEQIGAAITGITTGIGLILARDNDKSSEQVGAIKEATKQ